MEHPCESLGAPGGHGERPEALKADVGAGTTSRTVLLGKSIPGNAWDDYLLAIAELRKHQNWNGLQYILLPPQPKDRIVVESSSGIIPTSCPFRQGTRRREARNSSTTFRTGVGTTGGADAALDDVRWLAW